MVMKRILPNVSFDSIAEKATNVAGFAQNFVKETAEDFASKALSARGFAREARSRNLPVGGNPHADFKTSTAEFTSAEGKDWRVKLSLPNDPNFVNNNPLLAPLVETGGLAFPFTPSIVMSHSANYNAIQPVHTNYPFYAYENSQIDQMVITGPFVIQNALEAQYWIAVLHYLRSVTKMYYGQSTNNGNPPPVVRLNGYGDYVFNNVPVVISNFTLDLPGEVDYIASQVGSTTNSNSGVATGQGISYSPVESQITVTVQPTYSRAQVEQFSMDSFVKGDLILNGKRIYLMASYKDTSPYAKTKTKGFHLGFFKIRPVPAETDDVLYTIEPQYTHRPDLLAYDLYDDPKLWWVFAQRNMDVIKDPIYDMLPGTQIFLPQGSKLKSMLGI